MVDHYVSHSNQFDVAADIVNRKMLFIMGVTCMVVNVKRAIINPQLSRMMFRMVSWDLRHCSTNSTTSNKLLLWCQYREEIRFFHYTNHFIFFVRPGGGANVWSKQKHSFGTIKLENYTSLSTRFAFASALLIFTHWHPSNQTTWVFCFIWKFITCRLSTLSSVINVCHASTSNAKIRRLGMWRLANI